MFPTPVVNNNVRMFSDDSIQKAVSDAISNTQLPAGTKGAVVAHITMEGAKLSAIANLNGNWSVVAEAYKPYHGKLEAGAKVVFHW